VANRGQFHQVNLSPKKVLQGKQQAEVACCMLLWRNCFVIDKKIDIACRRIETIVDCRTEELKRSHTVPPTKIDDLIAFSVNQRSHRPLSPVQAVLYPILLIVTNSLDQWPFW